METNGSGSVKHEFKVGDRVKVKRTAGFRAGCSGQTIIGLLDNGNYVVSPGSTMMYAHELELETVNKTTDFRKLVEWVILQEETPEFIKMKLEEDLRNARN
jgi:hypothetical protein